MTIKTAIGFILLFLSSLAMQSQSIVVKADLDTNQILIGDQIVYRLEAEVHKDFQLQFPSFADTIMKGIEILEQSPIDTTFLSADLLSLTQTLLLTSFDSGIYILPGQAFVFTSSNFSDTLLTEPNFLAVTTFQIDSIQGIMDIKPPIDTPFVLQEALPATGIGLLIAALLLLSYWGWKKLQQRPKPAQEAKPQPKRPAHRIALEALDQLEQKKLWQQSEFKAFYSELSFIFRQYLENRFDTEALEQTTPEIVDWTSRRTEISSSLHQELREILELSDLVKFAKLEPLATENENVLKRAYHWVHQTKLSENLREPELLNTKSESHA